MGHLMRRNILAYKAPPNHEGYDLLCIHPDPGCCSQHIRIQVKSRLATDCDRGFHVRLATQGEFDFLIAAFLNVGYFFRKAKAGADPRAGAQEPQFSLAIVALILGNVSRFQLRRSRTAISSASPFRTLPVSSTIHCIRQLL